MHQTDTPDDGTIDGIDPLGTALLSMIKVIEGSTSTTKTKCRPVSDRSLLLRPVPGLLVLVRALG